MLLLPFFCGGTRIILFWYARDIEHTMHVRKRPSNVQPAALTKKQRVYFCSKN
jgi:hypothetical protein